MSPGTIFRINLRPCGDYAVQRFDGVRIIRWGIYLTEGEAKTQQRLANAGLHCTRHRDQEAGESKK